MLRPLSREEFTLKGRGGAVLLVHGLGGGPHELQWLGEHLHAELGWTVRAVQLPGHRDAVALMPHSTWPQWMAAVEENLERLERETGEAAPHVVAFSMGALPSLRLAQQGRLHGKLALLAPFVGVYRPAGVSVEWAMGLTPYVPRRGPPLKDKALRKEVKRCSSFDVFSLRSAQSALELARLVLAEAHKVLVPTLVLQGDRDTVVDPAGAEYLAARLGGPSCFQLVKDSDHLLALDAKREEVFATVTTFLRPGS